MSQEKKPKTEEKVENIERLELPKPETKRDDIIKFFLEKYEKPIGKIIESLSYSISGHPEQIKAEARTTLWATVGFIGLLTAMVIVTGLLSYAGKMSGEAVGFIFGTAFGSILAFLYKYLTPEVVE